ncbi:MAG: hypothetical protein ABIK97_03870 [candidate division WOR-3 bacterium]
MAVEITKIYPIGKGIYLTNQILDIADTTGIAIPEIKASEIGPDFIGVIVIAKIATLGIDTFTGI